MNNILIFLTMFMMLLPFIVAFLIMIFKNDDDDYNSTH
jgi:hypothetical protein